jgi:serine/threonine protein kinase
MNCPVCYAPYGAGETSCLGCGLVFASYRAPEAEAQDGPLQGGQTLDGGRYRVSRPLSRGGQGSLYLAADTGAFDRPVVIKVMHAEPADSGDAGGAGVARERFLSEARTLAQLKYPTIPQIFGFFQDGPHACIVMEYVEGRDLESGLTRHDDSGQRVLGEPYPREEVLRWGIALCTTLEYLGSRTPPVVHHDIKPANLVLDSHSRQVFLVDFTIARARRGITTQLDGQAPAAYGTPGYAPPEQYKGQGSPRSDVFALAATLYHLASDDDPRDHPFRFPHLERLGALGEALRPALSREPERRPDATALRRSLERLLSGGDAPATLTASGQGATATPSTSAGSAPSASTRATAWIGCVSALAMLVIAVAVGIMIASSLLRREPQPADPIATRIAIVDVDPAPTAASLATPLALPTQEAQPTALSFPTVFAEPTPARDPTSPPTSEPLGTPTPPSDVDYQSEVTIGEGVIMRVVELGIPLTALAVNPAFEPNLATADSTGRVIVWDSEGFTPTQRFALASPAVRLAYSPDGALLAMGEESGAVSLYDLRDGQERWYLSLNATRPASALAFSYDGEYVAFCSADSTCNLWPARSGTPATLEFDPAYGAPTTIAFHPSQPWLAVGFAGGRLLLWDLEQDRAIWEATPHQGALNGLSFDSGGDRLASASDDGSAQIVDAENGATLHTLGGSLQGVRCVAYDNVFGGVIATCGGDGVVRIWDGETGALLAERDGHEGPVSAASIGVAGVQLTSAGEDGTLRQWFGTLDN